MKAANAAHPTLEGDAGELDEDAGVIDVLPAGEHGDANGDPIIAAADAQAAAVGEPEADQHRQGHVPVRGDDKMMQ